MSSILETHDKTIIVMASFFITTGGWWAWNAFLSAIYAPAASPYGVRDGFISGFGKDPMWWLTLVGVLLILAVVELGYKTLKRQFIVKGCWTETCLCLPWNVFGRRKGGNDEELAVGAGKMEDWEVRLWQEMEKDPIIQTQLRATVSRTGESKEVLD